MRALPFPADPNYGQLFVTRLGVGADSVLVVDHADPRILVTAEVVELGERGELHPDVTLLDGLLTIDGVNRRVIYRIGDPVPWARCYEAAWPD